MKNLVGAILVSLFIIFCISFWREKRIKKEDFKTEYKIELINQTEIKVYSVSNDTTYICTMDKLVEVIEKDNL
jgi:hypothetical protein